MLDLRRYWRRRKYERLNGPKPKSVRLGRSRSRRARLWRIRIAPRLRVLRFASPKKLLIRLRDAYVSMMLSLASSTALSGGGGFSYGLGGPAAGSGFDRPPLKEYDEKVILEIYKSIVAQQTACRVV